MGYYWVDIVPAWQLQRIQGVLAVSSKCGTFPQPASENTSSFQTAVSSKRSLNVVFQVASPAPQENSISTHVDFVTNLRHFLQHVFINYRCELFPLKGFTGTREDSPWEPDPAPNILQLETFKPILSAHFFSHPCLLALQEQYAFNESSLLCPQGPVHLHKSFLFSKFLPSYFLLSIICGFNSNC